VIYDDLGDRGAQAEALNEKGEQPRVPSRINNTKYREDFFKCLN
jgi:hypothetical protein